MGVLALLLVTTGCAALGGNNWAAKVNGESIKVKDFNARVATAQENFTKQGMNFETEEGKQSLPMLKSQMLEIMVRDKIFDQEVRNLKLNTEDEKIKEQLDSIKQNYELKDDAELQNFLQERWMYGMGTTLTDYKNNLAVYEHVTSDVQVPDETELKAFFDENVDNYNQLESVTAHHILLAAEDEAKAVITQLQSAVNDQAAILPLFEQIAKEKSTDDGTKESGGKLGTFEKGQMVPEFEQAAFAQEEGTFSSTPVKTEFGYHVIFVEKHEPAKSADFAGMKPQVEEDALNAAKNEKFQTYFEDLHKNATVEYAEGYEPAG